MERKFIAFFVVIILFQLSKTMVYSQENKKKMAEKLNNEAIKMINKGKYSEAIENFKKAYEIYPLPEIFYNLGKAYDKVGDLEEAIKYYEKFKGVISEEKYKEKAQKEIDDIKNRLSLKKNLVRIEVSPSPAMVYFDTKSEENKFSSPAEKYLSFGMHKIIIEKEGYKEVIKDINVDRGNPVTFIFNLNKKQKEGKLTIDINEVEAEIYLNDKLVGKSPFQGVNLEPTTYELKIKKQGFKEFTQKVLIEEGKEVKLNVKLEKIPEKEVLAEEEYDKQGLQLNLSLGAGADTTNLRWSMLGAEIGYLEVKNNTNFSFGLNFEVIYRVIPYFSFGTNFHYNLMRANVYFGDSKNTSPGHIITTGFIFKGHPLKRSFFDPYVGFSVNYSYWATEGKFEYLTLIFKPKMSLHGIAFGIIAGIKFYVQKHLSIGPNFTYYIPYWLRFCVGGENVGSDCKDIGDIKKVSPEFRDTLPHLWFGSIETSYTF